MLHVISGAPCSGKSTYIKAHKTENDLVIDLDVIATALGSNNEHKATGNVYKAAQDARTAIIENLQQYNDSDIWLIDTKPSEKNLARYKNLGAEMVTLDPGIDECLKRSAERPAGTKEAIYKYYEKTPEQQFIELLQELVGE